MKTFNLGIIKVKFEADTKGLEEGTDKAKTTTSGVAQGINLAIGQTVVGAFQKAGQAAIDFAKESLQEFQAFEKGMKEVFTLLPGMSSQAYKSMERDALNFSAQVGRQSSEVVPALYQAISAGVPQDSVFDFMQVASDAALGGVTDLETAVDGITSVVNAYGAENITAKEASDLLFTAVKGGKTNFEQLSNSMYNVIPTASALGLEFGNVTAAMAAITAQGTPTSVATTQLRALLVELSNGGKKAAQTFERIAGKSFKEFLAEGGNLQDALQLMEQHANDTGVGLNELFSRVEAGNAALALTGAGAEKFSSELAAAENAAGATGEAAGTMAESLEFAQGKADAATERFMILVGDALAPAKQEALELQTTLATLAGDLLQLGGQAEDAANDLIAASEAEQDFTETGHKLAKLAGEFKSEGGLTGFIGVETLRDDLVEVTTKAIDFSKSNEEISASLKEVFGATAEVRDGMVYIGDVAIGTTSTLGELNQAYREQVQAQETAAAAAQAAAYDTKYLADSEAAATAVAEGYAEVQAKVTQEIIESAHARAAAAGPNQELSDKIAQTNSHISASEGILRAANAENKAYFENLKAEAAAAEEAAAAVAAHNAEMGKFFVEALNAEAGSGFFNESLDSLGTSFVEVGGLTADQRTSLEELQSEYDKVNDSIRGYQSGLDSIGLSEEERNAKIAEQQGRLAELDAAMAPLIGTTGTLTERNVEATINQGAVNQAIFDSAAASGASAVQLALLGGELGIYSEAAVEAALKSALIQEKIDSLAEAYVGGTMSVSEMRGELSTFIEGLDSAAEGLLGTSTANADVTTTGADASAMFAEMAESEGIAETAAGALGDTLGGSTVSALKNVNTEAANASDALKNIPTNIDVNVNIKTHGSIPNLPTGGAGGRDTPQAFSGGGYTGGVENEFAGVVHGEEYVFDAPSVRSIGLSNLERLRQQGNIDVINNTTSNDYGRNTVNVYMYGDVRQDSDIQGIGDTVESRLKTMGVEQ